MIMRCYSHLYARNDYEARCYSASKVTVMITRCYSHSLLSYGYEARCCTCRWVTFVIAKDRWFGRWQRDLIRTCKRVTVWWLNDRKTKYIVLCEAQTKESILGIFTWFLTSLYKCKCDAIYFLPKFIDQNTLWHDSNLSLTVKATSLQLKVNVFVSLDTLCTNRPR